MLRGNLVNEEYHYSVDMSEWFEAYKKREKEIKKIRHIYEYKNLKFEVDEFEGMSIILCEVELQNFFQPIEFPDYIQRQIIMEVTDFKQFSNYVLAQNIER
jgi:CYTH domain-containing protein